MQRELVNIIDRLPASAINSLLEYAEFLLLKYDIVSEKEEEELSEEMKVFLTKRMERHEANREKAIGIEELKNRLNKKYGFELECNS